MSARPLTIAIAATVVAALAISLSPAARAQHARLEAEAMEREQLLDRGRYLTLNVGMCVDCHGSTLHGAKLDFLDPRLPAARYAPRIAGLPKLNVAAATRYFETGKLPDGRSSRPPMPQYRLHHDDAVALATYLKNLP